VRCDKIHCSRGRQYPERVLAATHKEQWNTDGWCVIEDVIPADALAAAQDAVRRLLPTPAEMAEHNDPDNALWRTWDAQWPEFPFHSSRLNALVLHDRVLDLAEELLGTTHVAQYMGIVTAKYANQSSGFNQLLHIDYPNHMLVVPRHDVGYQQLEFFIYLTDVTVEDGATRFVSRRHTAHLPIARHTLNYMDYADLYDDPGNAAAPAGSVVAYRPDVFHRSIDFTDPTRHRVMLHVSFKPRGAVWGGYQAWPFRGFSPELSKFVQQATPRQLTVFGFPEPGHAYWNDDTLAGVQARYPALDLSAWRQA
jgi:ectoine hydroxylase-related dioxygenase (phytanoyl-CoA dioxygenase family)